ncbi:hypothetical protein FDH01_gp117 [Acinetobacter phage vB_AbaM_ME3]|uniref:Uncharacterized protein n=1 Tax=Acinetobacter phage vB_AbaM_ME3 TaxID=1837876 RepID=A0A172Q092_9CAUD|nr:hypothetical protein FDH01_gp117 [Acinetobacter phage vB_AbaM_ME3]AND75278.1 hypothetical protein ME3_117 [Acinetobacter phage vB_AbaM_ME3]
MVLEKVKELVSKVDKSKSDLITYVNSIDLKNLIITEELFLTLMPHLPSDNWLPQSFKTHLFVTCQLDIWDFGYSKYETVKFVDLCERINDLEDSHYHWTTDVEKARQEALRSIWYYAIKHKVSGFELNW